MPRRSRTYGREPSLLARADPGVLAHRAAGVWRPQAHMALMGDQVVQQRQWLRPHRPLPRGWPCPDPPPSNWPWCWGGVVAAPWGAGERVLFFAPWAGGCAVAQCVVAAGADHGRPDHGAGGGQAGCGGCDLGFCGQVAVATAAALGGLLHQFSPLVLPAGVLLLAAGVANAWRTAMGGTLLLLPGLAPWGAALEWVQAPWFWLVQLAGVFLQAGLLGFGGGLVIIPLLQDQVVGLGWLTGGQFLDGVAIGQVSPGPVVLTSAFVGYQAGWAAGGGPTAAMVGSLVATVAVFLPSVLFILVGSPLLQRIRRDARVQRFFAGVVAGVPGAVAGAAVPSPGPVCRRKSRTPERPCWRCSAPPCCCTAGSSRPNWCS